MRNALLISLLAPLLMAAGCGTYLRNGHQQAISLRTYDSAVIEAVELQDGSRDDRVVTALRDSLERQLNTSGCWLPATDGDGSRDLALRITISRACLDKSGGLGSAGPRFRLQGRLDVFDHESGQKLASTPLNAVYSMPACSGDSCSSRPAVGDEQQLRQGAVTELAAAIVKILTSAKQTRQDWERMDLVMGEGC